MSDIIYPTEEQTLRAKEIRLRACGTPYYEAEDDLNWSLVLLLNKDKILEAPYAYTPPNYPEVVRKAIEEYPDAGTERLLGLIMKEQHGKTDSNAVRAEIFRQSQPPIALTEDHIPSLERAIRAEGYDIKVDTETGEVKLYRVTADGSLR